MVITLFLPFFHLIPPMPTFKPMTYYPFFIIITYMYNNICICNLMGALSVFCMYIFLRLTNWYWINN